jgi:hypothetical protein
MVLNQKKYSAGKLKFLAEDMMLIGKESRGVRDRDKSVMWRHFFQFRSFEEVSQNNLFYKVDQLFS